MYMRIFFVKDAFHVCISCSTNVYFPWYFSVFTNREQIDLDQCDRKILRILGGKIQLNII